MGIAQKKKDFVPWETNSFFIDLTPIRKRGKNENGRVTTPACISTHPEYPHSLILKDCLPYLFHGFRYNILTKFR